MSVRVSAPCRLHFGLFHVPVPGLTHWPDGRPVRKFGGVGLMVETPRVVVEVRINEEWAVTGTLAARAGAFARRMSDEIPPTMLAGRPYDIRADGPPEHIGLGVGTALAMSVGRGICHLHYLDFLVEGQHTLVASSLGRGLRSGIGVHGFASGGLLVDGGKQDREIPKLVERLHFPPEWRVVLIRPPVDTVWHGDTERNAFGRDRVAVAALAVTERLHNVCTEALTPAVKRADFDTFSAAVHEFNRIAGEPFAADQGGPYSSPTVTGVIDELLGWGMAGVGQSSWGPTVFAFARDADEANHIANRARAWLPADADVTVTAADNHGARVEIL